MKVKSINHLPAEPDQPHIMIQMIWITRKENQYIFMVMKGRTMFKMGLKRMIKTQYVHRNLKQSTVTLVVPLITACTDWTKPMKDMDVKSLKKFQNISDD